MERLIFAFILLMAFPSLVLSAEPNELELVLPIGHIGSIYSVAFSPDGRLALSGSNDETLKLWDINTGREIRTFSGHTEGVESVAFSPDGKYALSGSLDETLKLWYIDTGKEIRTFSGHAGGINCVAFSHDGRFVLSGSGPSNVSNYEGFFKMWDVTADRELRSLSGHKYCVSALTISSDDRLALTGSCDKTLKLWDMEMGMEIQTFSGHEYVITSVAMTSDGNLGLSNSEDKTIKVWDTNTGKEMRTFSGHGHEVLSIATSPDDNLVLSCSKDRTLKLWDINTGELLFTRVHLDESDWALVTPDGRYDGSPGGLKLMHYVKDNKPVPLDPANDPGYVPNLMAELLKPYEKSKKVERPRASISSPPEIIIVMPSIPDSNGEWDDETEEGYWLPSDASRYNMADWLTNSDIAAQIRRIRAKNILIISDACFSGQIFVAKDANARSPVETDVSVQKNYETVSRRALTSGAKETVRDGNVFVGHLVKRLEEEQGDYLYAERLYVDIKDIVTNSSRTRQTPEYGVIQRAGDEGSDFVFFRKSD